MILIRLQGGLGNQMFQYAFARYLAVERNDKLMVDLSLLNPSDFNDNTVKREFELFRAFGIEAEVASQELIEKFNGKPHPSFRQRLTYWIRRKLGRHPLFIQSGHELVDASRIPRQDVCLVGRFQSYTHIQSIDKTIRREFDLDRLPVGDETKRWLAGLKDTCTVSIHVRRGDYVAHPVYSKILGGLNLDYYRSCVNRIEGLLTNTVIRYVVVSDDIEWCKRNLDWLTNVHFQDNSFNDLSHLSDLYLLASTDHSIISNSTFGWWGGFLGHENRIVCAPKRWSKDVSHSPPGLIPNSWILVENDFD